MSTSKQPTVSGPAQVSAEKLADALHKLSKQLLWRNYRASSEVKDAVGVVAAELERTAETLKACAPTLPEQANVQSYLALLEAKDKLTLLDDMVRAALRGAEGSASFIGAAARLKLALAKLEATDLFEEKRRRLQHESRRAQAMTEATLKELEERLAAQAELNDAQATVIERLEEQVEFTHRLLSGRRDDG